MRNAVVMISLIAILVASHGRYSRASAQTREPASKAALVRSIAPLDDALTFAQVKEDRRFATLLVVEETKEGIRALNLSAQFDLYDTDPLELLNTIGRERIIALARSNTGAVNTYRFSHVLPAGGSGTSHVAAGTNYPEHGSEVGIGRVFSFPKYAAPTPPIASIAARDGMLLDYEVEICARFDRDLRTLEDFDRAVIGFFLCTDYTDRAVLARLIDRNDLASGIGYTDAKSGAEFFACGPYLVVPVDWRFFVAAERITTTARGERRQDAKGGQMIEDLRQIVGWALSQGMQKRWRYQGQPVALLDEGVLRRGSAVLTGTPEGIIFRPPTFTEKASGFLAYVFGGFLSGRGPVDYVVERFIDRLQKSRTFLQSGDVVQHESSRMGMITVNIR